MRARLPTSTVHRLISSPLGALLDTPTYERFKLERLPFELRLLRLGAMASALGSSDADELITRLGARGEVSSKMRRRLARGLARFARARAAREDVMRRWERVFWGEPWPPPDRKALVELELERRIRARRCLFPRATLGFFASKVPFEPIAYGVPSPGEVASKWAQELAHPELLYGLPAELPAIERSRSLPGPAGPEYLLRFRSPSRIGDVVHARVFEPERKEDIPATFIYAGGLFSACDDVVYWPEEEAMGRGLAARGHRVVLLALPGHGRRAPPGKASGEVILSTGPEGLFRLCAAGAQEMAVLIAWARELGSSVVGVGGASIGALVAQALCGRARSFPRGMRPDAAFLAGAALRLDEVILDAPLAERMGLSRAILEAGWTREALACLRDLFDPPSEPGIAPERIHAVLGLADPFLPAALGRELLRAWHVPEGNITLRPGGQVGLLIHLVRDSDARLTIAGALHRAVRAVRA
ncbi:alpha/beta hydrolase [Polyangium spumosum]|uniref:Alpha/beta hydrolase n=1 Tax=Polyangium spumosum TaxID=889282 RepID=A0A6N7PT47_9BACT|nr:hypothetical protein [Polyangium spumosum]MRG95153.1 hypothetical protein [Polyangium spumosum]